ncbi:TetR/AcrR family transcriptional regulator [Empedobacter brevis]|uniref:TetR/AcrR family transcriptional regulator n=1 Tax=Empedobacter brevis TaxID=247 RepID=UPI00289A0173|nr:TetR/AcrR family transcriptional regulator [Empedobacter brevis]
MTKEIILKVGLQLLLEKGYNGFSYADVSDKVKIKKASIHYHFPTKVDLLVTIIDNHTEYFRNLRTLQSKKTAEQSLSALINYYLQLINTDKICLMGSLANTGDDLPTIIKEKSQMFCDEIHSYTVSILEKGMENKEFKAIENVDNKAIEILASLMGLTQLSRLYHPGKMHIVIQNIVQQLKTS